VHSLKSTGIAVLLLAVSVGLYQFSATDTPSSNIDLATELGVSDGSMPAFGQQQPFNGQNFGQQLQANYPNNGQLQGQLVSSNGFQNPIQHPAQPAQGSQNRYPIQQPNQAPISPPNFAHNLQSQPIQSGQTIAAPSFDQLRDKFNQTANNTINSGSNQVNQQFANLQNQAQNQFNQFNQSVGQTANQTVNQATKATQNFGNQLAGNFRSNVDSLQQNITKSANDFQQSMPDLAAATSSTRQAVEPNRDDGLIDALQTELNSAAENVSIEAPSGGDFQVPPIQKAPEISIDNEFSSNDFNPQPQAQPIELTDNTKNRLVSEQTPLGDIGSDFNVQQANVTPEFDSHDAAAVGNIDQAWAVVEKMVAEENFRGALAMLTRYYRSGDLTSQQQAKLNDWLDALAGKVIYSAENHFTKNAYKIQAGETLADIANRWQVPAQVVYNINRKQIGNEPNVIAGTELKMIKGPFHAEVDMSSQTLTLYLKNLYAGRFPVKLGISGNPRPGSYNVVAKSVQGHTWRDADGNDFPPESPENGYGPYWIGMTGSLCIHAVSADEISGHSGCVGLSEKDAKDIFGILANRSKVNVVE